VDTVQWWVYWLHRYVLCFVQHRGVRCIGNGWSKVVPDTSWCDAESTVTDRIQPCTGQHQLVGWWRLKSSPWVSQSAAQCRSRDKIFWRDVTATTEDKDGLAKFDAVWDSPPVHIAKQWTGEMWSYLRLSHTNRAAVMSTQKVKQIHQRECQSRSPDIKTSERHYKRHKNWSADWSSNASDLSQNLMNWSCKTQPLHICVRVYINSQIAYVAYSSLLSFRQLLHIRCCPMQGRGKITDFIPQTLCLPREQCAQQACTYINP